MGRFYTRGRIGRDPFNQTFRKFRSKTQWIGSVQPEKFRKTGPPLEVVLFSRSDRLEFWLNGSRPLSVLTGNASMAVFILRTHYPSGRTWANIFGSSGYAYEV